MATFYIDYVNGSDAYAGDSFAAGHPCLICGKTFYEKPHEGKKRFSGRKYCSANCSFQKKVWNDGVKGVCQPNSGSFKKGQVSLSLGRPVSEQTRKKISNSKKGRSSQPCSIETRLKISEAQKGEKARLWQGGLTKANKIIRMSCEYRLWRESVFARDDWTCQDCGQRGGILHPHHIKPFAVYPDYRFDVDNGLTLCQECHKKTNSYARNICQLSM